MPIHVCNEIYLTINVDDFFRIGTSIAIYSQWCKKKKKRVLDNAYTQSYSIVQKKHTYTRTFQKLKNVPRNRFFSNMDIVNLNENLIESQRTLSIMHKSYKWYKINTNNNIVLVINGSRQNTTYKIILLIRHNIIV